MTNELRKMIELLTARMNRVEAMVADMKRPAEPLCSAIDNAIAAMNRATAELESRLPASDDCR